ncbi:translocation/assembly module TamB [Buchnera aphidicola (Hyperomyzus lactucae)]|uniref:Translocation/assembly module TamB n=1 Tax=Buchnera aphidicola (Hyperomyzus lactucae) TaxID=1241860 RepID=A0A4D6XY12_9GAMM|nr:translocation/assembly module TamB [Buchnera aphidicola]QCI20829.1 translocation/assembly module TamB [Buchnera aphidicola (Hyperomyzus lactucae)]
MSIYQRCLSKSLIFFSVFFIIFLLFIESSIGFKWVFNFTSCFFTGLKTEEILGNWRDFTLKNIKYNVFGFSIKANSIHVIIDIKSFFKNSTIFKEINAKNLIISLEKSISANVDKKNRSIDFKKNNIFVKFPIIFQKIYVDKILLKTSKTHISFFKISSGLELINNKIIFSPTDVSTIHITSPHLISKKNIFQKLDFIKTINNSNKIYDALYFFANKPKIFIPLNINLKLFKCKRINFKNYKKNNLFQVKLKAKVKNNILKIKRLQIDSTFLKIKSYGKIIFHNNSSISCLIKNKIFIPRFHNRIIKFLFKANLTNKLIFKLQTNNLYKTNIHGRVLLDHLDYPFYINLKSKNLLWSIRKDLVLKLNDFNGMLMGKINNYSLSLKNVFSIEGMPSVFINIYGRGNLQNIYIKHIKCFPIKQKKIDKETINFKKNVIYNKHILDLIGKINLSGRVENNLYNLYIPKIDLHSNIMKKKISILGSLYYKNFNLLEIPGINLLAGNNKLFLQGSLGKKYNVYSSIYANKLDYFLPDLKGRIKAKIRSYNKNNLPTITSKILSDNLQWNNIYSKSIKIFTNINVQDADSGNILVNAKKIHFSNFHINSLHIQTKWNCNKQTFYFLLKSNKIYVNLILNGVFNDKTGNWHGLLKKINIKTFLGSIKIKKSPVISYSNSNNNISDFYKKNIKIKDTFSFLLKKTRTSLYETFHQSLINFKSEVSIDAKLKWMLGENISSGKLLLTGDNIILEKKTTEKKIFENIDYLKLSMNIIKNTFESKWMIIKNKNSLKNTNAIGYLNIIDIYNTKNIEGKCTFSYFPVSFLNFFTNSFKKTKGTFESNINIFGTLSRPKISADLSFQDIFIKSDNLLKYITLFFPYFLNKTENIRINQEVIIKKGNILFTLDFISKKSSEIEWNLLFNSKKIELIVLPKIKIKLSSQLNLHYLYSKYDLIGYIKFSLFYFRINEKNFIF